MMKKICFIVVSIIMSVLSVVVMAADKAPLLISQSTETTENAIAADAQQSAKLSFSDITEEAPYKDAVYKLVENGVLNGYLDGTFRPQASLTRAEMCKMINLTFGYTDIEGAVGFPDLEEGEWYIPYVLAAQKAGYVQGDAIGTFRPNDSISREEVCAILYRIIKPYDLDIPVVINDNVSDWARVYVEAMVKNSLIPLEEGGTFRATEPIKRHELATAVAPHSHIKVDEIKCTITFLNGEEKTTMQVVIGKSIENMPTITNISTGYKFAGWSRVENDAVFVDAQFIFLSDTTLYARFDKNEYNVKFVLESGTEISTQKVKYKEFATKPIDPAKTDFEFKGWAVGGTLVDINTYEIVSDTVFTAVFEKSDEEMSSGGGGGGGGFGGGGTGGNQSGGNESGGNESGEDVVISYRVVFISNGKTVKTQTVTKGETPELPDEPTLDGYTFMHWSNEENGDKVDVESKGITSDTTYYAVFELEETNPNDSKIILALKKAITQFDAMRLSTEQQRSARQIVKDTVALVLADAEAGEYIDSKYVKQHYNEQLVSVKKILNEDMSENERSDFISRVSNNVDDETFNLLSDFFLNEETKDEYLKDE